MGDFEDRYGASLQPLNYLKVSEATDDELTNLTDHEVEFLKGLAKPSNNQVFQTTTPSGRQADFLRARHKAASLNVISMLHRAGPGGTEAGTAIRWLSHAQQSQRSYTYVGVWTGGLWFITGTGQFYKGNEFTWDQMLEHVLAHHDVTAIQLATEWIGR